VKIFPIKVTILSFAFALVLAVVPQSVYAQANKNYKKQAIKRELELTRKVADRNLNGHYISLGSSLLSAGYYGKLAGVAYEYRHRNYSFFAPNVSVGVGTIRLTDHSYNMNANVGAKFYFAKKIKVLRNLYVNVLPFCYLGQKEEYTIGWTLRNNEVIKIDEYKYPHLYGAGVFLGYAPVWHVGKRVALGFNVDVGTKTNYLLELNPNGFIVNWDLGIILKFSNKINRCNN